MSSGIPRMMARMVLLLALALLALQAIADEADVAALPWHIQILPVPSKTFTAAELLRGGTTGRDVVLAGELRLPVAVLQGKVPAVVLVHGAGGIATNADSWARVLNQAGMAVFILDCFTARGIVSTVEDQSQLDSLAMMYDAFRALDVLAAHPSINPDKIAVMGFSKGAVAAVFSSGRRFAKAYGGTHLFAAHVGLYAPCNTRLLGDTQVSSAPIRFFQATQDDYVSVGPCRTFAAELMKAGADAAIVEFPATWHAFDVRTYPPVYELKTAQSTRNCRLVEGRDGIILNADTKMPYLVQSDPCVALGAHIGYNPDAAKATQEQVIALLKKTFSG